MKVAPTEDDIAAYFRAAAALPDINFGPSFEKEKALNTPRYQQIVVEAERLLIRGGT